MAKTHKARMFTNRTTIRLQPLAAAIAASTIFAAPSAFSADEANQGGYKVGEFMVIPNASVSERYDDNIYGANTGEKDDTITNVAASVEAKSEWQRHRLNLDAGVSADYFNDYDSEDVVNWWAGADGRYDLSAKSHALAGVKFSQDHESRSSPESTINLAQAAEPTPFTTAHGHLGFAHRLAPFTIRLGAVYEALDYKDVEATVGPDLDNDYRDRAQYSLGMRFSYQMKNAPEIFFQASTDTRDYDDNTDGRDSDGYRLGLGMRYDKGPAFQAEAFLGYLEQNYDSLTLKDVDTIYFGGNLKWRPNIATRVSAALDRSVNETTLPTASSYLDTTVSGQLERDLSSHLSLNANLGYTKTEYQGYDLDMDQVTAGVGARYYFNKLYYLAGGYRYTTRDANITLYDYDDNLIFVSLGYTPRKR